MKGIVFTEFLEMVEDRFSPEVADRIIVSSDLASGGAYTAVGTYDYQEMVQLVSHLSDLSGIAISDLLQTYGKYLFNRFVAGYPEFFQGIKSAFEFLKNVEGHIHLEVRKLYPDAELPTFEYVEPKEDQLIMTYRSPRAFADLAEGLLIGCVEHFNEKIEIHKEDLSNGQGTVVEFSLTRLE